MVIVLSMLIQLVNYGIFINFSILRHLAWHMGHHLTRNEWAIQEGFIIFLFDFLMIYMLRILKRLICDQRCMCILGLMSLKCLGLNCVADGIAYGGHSLISCCLRYDWTLIDGMILLYIALRWLHWQLIGIHHALLIHRGPVIHGVLCTLHTQSSLIEVERCSSRYCKRRSWNLLHYIIIKIS